MEQSTNERVEKLDNLGVNDAKDDYENLVRHLDKTLKDQLLIDDRFDPLDYLSRLPNPCILMVFKHLTRRDLFNVSCARKRFRPFYHEKSLDCVKWKADYLGIHQTESGYGFELEIVCTRENYPWRLKKTHRLFSYHYEVIKSESGQLIEKKTTNNRQRTKALDDPDHAWPTPDEFFDALEKILRHHQPRVVSIEDISVDIFAKLAKAFEGQKTEELRCVEMECASITNDASKARMIAVRKGFTDFVRNITRLELEDSPELVPLFDEHVLTEIAKLRVPERSLVTFTEKEETYDQRFYPSEAILPHLIHYKTLSLFTMVLNANWITALIMKCMDEAKCQDIEWQFVVNGLITRETIAQTLRLADFECKTAKDGLRHNIARKNNRRNNAAIESIGFLRPDEPYILVRIRINYQQ